jgi:sorbitol-specific phosphotransferase system component IIC
MEETTDNDRISRKEAVTKISKYAALTALGTFMILNPQKAQAGSHPPTTNGDPFAF